MPRSLRSPRSARATSVSPRLATHSAPTAPAIIWRRLASDGGNGSGCEANVSDSAQRSTSAERSATRSAGGGRVHAVDGGGDHRQRRCRPRHRPRGGQIYAVGGCRPRPGIVRTAAAGHQGSPCLPPTTGAGGWVRPDYQAHRDLGGLDGARCGVCRNHPRVLPFKSTGRVGPSSPSTPNGAAQAPPLPGRSTDPQRSCSPGTAPHEEGLDLLEHVTLGQRPVAGAFDSADDVDQGFQPDVPQRSPTRSVTAARCSPRPGLIGPMNPHATRKNSWQSNHAAERSASGR